MRRRALARALARWCDAPLSSSRPSPRARTIARASSTTSNDDDENFVPSAKARAFMRALNLRDDDLTTARDEVRPRDKAYVDRRRVRAEGGRGGGGVASFAMDGGSRRRRGADGGDGGKGGDVVLVACARTKGLGDVKNLLRGAIGGREGRRDGSGVEARTRARACRSGPSCGANSRTATTTAAAARSISRTGARIRRYRRRRTRRKATMNRE